MRWSLLGVLMLCIIFAVPAGASLKAMVLEGVADDCLVLSDLLAGVSGAIARIAGLPFEFKSYTAYQMADLGLLCALRVDRGASYAPTESHIQDVFDWVGDLALSLLREQPFYVGLYRLTSVDFEPFVWARVTYDDPRNLDIEYVEVRPSLLRTALIFSAKLDRALGEAVVLSWDGCVAVPTVGVLIDLELDLYHFDLPWDLNERGEWEAALLEVLKTDGEALFEDLEADERLVIVTPDGLFGGDWYERMYFSIPRASYLDVATWDVFLQSW